PRPRPRRADALRRRARARARRAPSRRVAAGARAGAPAGRRGALGGVTIEHIPIKSVPGARTRPVGDLPLDVRKLADDLRSVVDGEVRFSNGDRARYAT